MEHHDGRIIDLECVRHNIRTIREAVPASTGILAVVKADAYGHGACQTARAALEAGASWLAVALPREGKELRENGIEAPVLVLGAASGMDAQMAAVYHLTMTVCTCEQVRELSRPGLEINVHLKVDTGMGRIGVRTDDELQEVLEEIKAHDCLHLTGVFTHFADCDGDDDGMRYTHMQLERFKHMCSLLPEGIVRHCANSAAIHRLMPEAAFDLVRAGISMYGYPPVPTDLPLQQPMSWKARVTHVKTLESGCSVSYGRIYTTDHGTRVATIACGYGDGYHRACTGKAQVLLHGRRANVIGRICMDQMMVDVTDLPQVKAGDVVTLMGRDGDECISAEEIARWAGTISYEILLAATGRVNRTWLNE